MAKKKKHTKDFLKNKNPINFTKSSRVQKTLNYWLKSFPNEEDPNITFEYLIGSCFPTVMQNVQNTINKAYQDGYNDAMKDWKEINKK